MLVYWQYCFSKFHNSFTMVIQCHYVHSSFGKIFLLYTCLFLSQTLLPYGYCCFYISWLFLCWHVCFPVDTFFPPSTCLFLLYLWCNVCSSISIFFPWLTCNQESFYVVNHYVIYVNRYLCRQVCFSSTRVGYCW